MYCGNIHFEENWGEMKITHEIKVMFCVKILRVASYEILQAFHRCFAVSYQGVQFIVKLGNLRKFCEILINVEVFCTKFPMKSASKGFEQNLQRHKESERRFRKSNMFVN